MSFFLASTTEDEDYNDFEAEESAKRIKLDAILQRMNAQIAAQDSNEEDGVSVIDDRTNSPSSTSQDSKNESDISEDESRMSVDSDQRSNPDAEDQDHLDNVESQMNALFQEGGSANDLTANEWKELTKSLGKKGTVTLEDVNLEIHKIKISRHSEHSIEENQYQIQVHAKEGRQPLLSSIENAIMEALRSILTELKRIYPSQDYYITLTHGQIYGALKSKSWNFGTNSINSVIDHYKVIRNIKISHNIFEFQVSFHNFRQG